MSGLNTTPEPGGPGKRKQSHRKPNGQYVWSDHLILSRGGPRDCVANVAMVLREDPAFADKLAFDLFRQRTVVDGMPWRATTHLRDWVSRDDIALAEWCQLHGLVAKPGTCAQAVETVAHEREIHPLRERLEALEWDGDERLSTWLATYLDVERSDYAEHVGRKWMISAVARAYQQGCKADHALILEGPQGAGKSTACSILALDLDWFTDEIADLGTKESAQNLPGKWLIELGELSAMKRGEVERIKSFISRSTDHYRPSYGHRSQDFQRGCIFIGSTNATEYLADQTGNRRFWPVKVGRINLEGLRQNIEQLWAEAVDAYHEGEQWWLDAESEVDAAEEQELRVETDPWGELVIIAAAAIHNQQPFTRYDNQGIKHIATPDATRATTNAILDLLNIPIERRGKREETRIGIVMRKAKWTREEDREAKPPAPRHWYEPPKVWR